MADPVVVAPIPLIPPPAPALPVTNPLAPGKETSEGILAHIVVFISGAIAVLGTLTTTIASVTSLLPAGAGDLSKWLAIGGATCSMLTSIAYTLQRGSIKVAAINAGAANAAATSPDDAAAKLGGLVTP